MYAIKTADIVLFGGCNQLNMTHTKGLNSQAEKKRTHATIAITRTKRSRIRDEERERRAE